MRGRLAAFALALAAVPAGAEEAARLDEAGLHAVFGGATLAGVYSDGVGWSEHTTADGRADLRNDGEPPAPGRWWAAGTVLCFDYDTGGLHCFEVWRRSRNCFDNYVVRDGAVEATLEERRAGVAWSSRGSRTDAPATCPGEAVAGGAPAAGAV